MMPQTQDHYQVLGVSRTCTEKEISISYRRLALVHHPDRNRGHDSTAEFQKIQRAYETLIDPPKRRIYDYDTRGIASFFTRQPHASQRKEAEETIGPGITRDELYRQFQIFEERENQRLPPRVRQRFDPDTLRAKANEMFDERLAEEREGRKRAESFAILWKSVFVLWYIILTWYMLRDMQNVASGFTKWLFRVIAFAALAFMFVGICAFRIPPTAVLFFVYFNIVYVVMLSLRLVLSGFFLLVTQTILVGGAVCLAMVVLALLAEEDEAESGTGPHDNAQQGRQSPSGSAVFEAMFEADLKTEQGEPNGKRGKKARQRQNKASKAKV